MTPKKATLITQDRAYLIAVLLVAVVAAFRLLDRSRGPSVPSTPRVTVCTQIVNEVPYVVEWVLFYRALQGVSRVSICDHGSTDDAHLLGELFASHGIDGIIVEPAPKVETGGDVQLACYNACLKKYRDNTDWFLAADVDEYIYAPGYERLVDYLAAQPANVSQITAAELRFGSTGRVRRLTNSITTNETTGGLTYGDGAGGTQLITLEHTRRGASGRLLEPERRIREAMFPDCKRPVRCCDGFIVCDNNHGKSIARTSYLRRLTHHRHSVVEGGEDFSSQGDLRMHHYAVRSYEDAVIKASIWNKTESMDIWNYANEYQNSFSDVSMLRYRSSLEAWARLLREG